MPEHLDQLAFELFSTFARFEYALKTAGFHNGDGVATPNWRSFAESVRELFDHSNDPEFIDSIKYILEHPPKKQTIRNGSLNWRKSTPATDLKSDLVLLYVRRVRNNLFHGGKFNGHWFEPQRSELLLRHCLTILRACIDSSEEVRAAYNG